MRQILNPTSYSIFRTYLCWYFRIFLRPYSICYWSVRQHVIVFRCGIGRPLIVLRSRYTLSSFSVSILFSLAIVLYCLYASVVCSIFSQNFLFRFVFFFYPSTLPVPRLFLFIFSLDSSDSSEYILWKYVCLRWTSALTSISGGSVVQDWSQFLVVLISSPTFQWAISLLRCFI